MLFIYLGHELVDIQLFWKVGNKICIQNGFDGIILLVKDIEHLGGEISMKGNENDGIKDNDAVKNTMLEFYLMSFSNSILSMSVYGHMSGFSKYCAEIFNIPFHNMKI